MEGCPLRANAAAHSLRISRIFGFAFRFASEGRKCSCKLRLALRYRQCRTGWGGEMEGIRGAFLAFKNYPFTQHVPTLTSG